MSDNIYGKLNFSPYISYGEATKVHCPFPELVMKSSRTSLLWTLLQPPLLIWLAEMLTLLRKNPLFNFSCFSGSSSTCTYYKIVYCFITGMFPLNGGYKASLPFLSQLILCPSVSTCYGRKPAYNNNRTLDHKECLTICHNHYTRLTTPQDLLHHETYYITRLTTSQDLLHHKTYYTTRLTTPQDLPHHKTYHTTRLTTPQDLLHHKTYYTTRLTTPQDLPHHKTYHTTRLTTPQDLLHHKTYYTTRLTTPQDNFTK